ncbi:MAG: hypothetical protein ABSD67_11105 [Terracidiphilus sp.]|jgi:hypothetical protein
MACQWPVGELDCERLLVCWRWLCPQQVTLINRNAYGDLFLRDEEGKVFWLDVATGSLSQIADSESRFLVLSKEADKLEEWFAEADSRDAAERGLTPGPSQCIGFSVPLAFAESASGNKPYIADIYEHVGFLGDLHKQIATMPDGAKVKLIIK